MLISQGGLHAQTLQLDSLSAKKDTLSFSGSDTIRLSASSIDVAIVYSSEDSTIFDLKNQKVYLFGKAKVKYGEMTLEAARMVIDMKTKQLFATGITDSAGYFVDRPHFDDGDLPVDADTMIYNFNTKRGRTYGVRLVEGDGYILCNKVFRDDDKNIYSDRGRYTTCDLDHPHFYLEVRKLKIIPDDKIVFGPANLVIEDVPTPLVLPFGMFPTKKGQKSGIIQPDPGFSSTYGPYVRNMGYYFAISEKFDQVVRADVYFRGSWALHTDSRYAQRYRYRGNFSLSYSNLLPAGLEREDPGFKAGIAKTAQILWSHQQDAKARPNTNFSANVNIQRGKYSQLNSVNPTQIVASNFNSSVTYSKVLYNGKVNITTGLTHSQDVRTGDFDLSLPTLTVGVARITPFVRKVQVGRPKWFENISFSYTLDAENRIHTKDSLFFEGKAFDKFQNGITHTIPITFGSFKVFRNFISITPTISYKEYWYNKTMTKVWNSKKQKLDTIINHGFTRGAEYSGGVNATTQIFGTYRFNSKKVNALRHVMTPSIGINYKPDFSEKRFGYYYDVQSDSIGKISRLSIFEGGIKGGPSKVQVGSLNFGLNNNLQAKVLKKTDTSAKYENVNIIENLSINGNYNFLGDSFQLSNISVSGFTRLFKIAQLNASANLDPYHTEGNRRINKLEFGKSGRVGTWRSALLSLAGDVSSDMFKPKDSPPPSDVTNDLAKHAELVDLKQNPDNYNDFNRDWSLGVNTSIQYARNNYRTTWTPTLSFHGDLNVTENWKVGYNSGYDFNNKKIAYTQFNITRNLHCWVLDFQWIPDGIRKSFQFSIHVNSAKLAALKVSKKRNWYDQ
ncbi:MAG: LPS-assembly protein LptD [Bacteroidia bacterium]|nr:LPS-assembly protein LptD [Bacteroidia bacterium]